jgi:hypothetical protein
MPSFLDPELPLDEARDILRTNFKNKAQRRIEEAIQHPEDPRYSQAAVLLNRLDKSVDEVPEDLVRLFAMHWSPEPEGDSVSSHQAEYDNALNRVGFGNDPQNATEFLQAFTDAG